MPASSTWPEFYWLDNYWQENYWIENAVIREYRLQISYNPTFQMSRSAEVLIIEPRSVLRQAVAPSGVQHTKQFRTADNGLEPIVAVQWYALPSSDIELLHTYWEDNGRLGRQCEIILDPVERDAGSWEVDVWNTYFDQAELINPFDFHPRRCTYEWSGRFDIEMAWRQGA